LKQKLHTEGREKTLSPRGRETRLGNLGVHIRGGGGKKTRSCGGGRKILEDNEEKKKASVFFPGKKNNHTIAKGRSKKTEY